MDIHIRPARPEELDDVGELTARAYLGDGLLHFGESDSYLEVLRNARRRALHAEMLVAVESAEGPGAEVLLGTVAFVGDGGEYADIAEPGEGEFRMLAVRTEGRRRGVGEALVRACVERARERGLARLVLSSAPEMRAAHRLYERLGFRRVRDRDWEPIPGLVSLRVYALELGSGA